MLGDHGGEEVGAVDVDVPELAHTVDRIVDGLEVLGEAGRGDEVVDLAVLLDDVVEAGPDRGLVRHVGVVGGDLGHAGGARVLAAEDLDELGGLLLGFVFCRKGRSVQMSASSSNVYCRTGWG